MERLALVDLVGRAAYNNILQSEAVLQALGSRGNFTDGFWSNDHRFPIPYANGATLGGLERAEHQLAEIERFTASRPADAPTYIMDSRAALNLAPLGYQVRIADEWFVRTTPVEPQPDPRVVRIATTADLAAFEAASVAGFGDTPPSDAGHTYHPALINDARFQFFAARVDGAIASGVMLFHDPDCTGVYTFFTLSEHRGHGLGTAVLQHALGYARNSFLATNPSDMSQGIFGRLGFQNVGQRRIWVKSLTAFD